MRRGSLFHLVSECTLHGTSSCFPFVGLSGQSQKEQGLQYMSSSVKAGTVALESASKTELSSAVSAHRRRPAQGGTIDLYYTRSWALLGMELAGQRKRPQKDVYRQRASLGSLEPRQNSRSPPGRP